MCLPPEEILPHLDLDLKGNKKGKARAASEVHGFSRNLAWGFQHMLGDCKAAELDRVKK